MSDTQGKATRSQQAAERLMEFYLPSMSQAMMAYEIHGFYVDLEASHDKLLEALKAARDRVKIIADWQGYMQCKDVAVETGLEEIEAAIQSGEEPGSTSAFAPNSTAHEMPERDDGHIAVTHTGCTQPYCSIREGGLFLCSQCGSTEGATTSECPGERMTEAQIDLVYAGKIDFRGGKWVEECSPHTPVAYRDRSLHLRASRDVRARWERLGLDPSTAPTVFASDVENMVEEELRRLRDGAGRAVVQYSDPAL